MDWANEDYVKVYTRKTADDLELSWQALGLWRALLCEFDRSGLISVRNGWLSIAKLVRMPDDVTVSAGSELERDGRVVMVAGGVFAPNFTEAQTTSKSDKARQRESRDRRRASALDPQVLRITDGGHTASQPVTSGHAASRDVTLSLSSASPSPDPDPLLALDPPIPPQGGEALKLEIAKPDPSSKPAARTRKTKGAYQCAADERAVAMRVLGKLGERNQVAYEGCDDHVRLIVEQLRIGRSERDLRAVVAYCAEVKKWEADPEWVHCLNPATLFGPKNITRYLDPARSWAAKVYPDKQEAR